MFVYVLDLFSGAVLSVCFASQRNLSLDLSLERLFTFRTCPLEWCLRGMDRDDAEPGPVIVFERFVYVSNLYSVTSLRSGSPIGRTDLL